nr:MAG TPA: hypothetical protein [Bacteriophage sp.]
MQEHLLGIQDFSYLSLLPKYLGNAKKGVYITTVNTFFEL